MGPLVIPGIAAGIGGLGSILSMIFGPETDITKQRKMLQQFLQQNYGPGALTQNYNQIFDQMQASPGFQNTLKGINASAAGFGSNAARALGRTGASTSGIGALAGAAAQSAGGFGRAQARGGLSNAALQAAQQNLANQMQTFSFGNQQLNPYYNPWQQMFGGLMGGGAMGLMQPQGGGQPQQQGQEPKGPFSWDQLANIGRYL